MSAALRASASRAQQPVTDREFSIIRNTHPDWKQSASRGESTERFRPAA
jgi:hypothetical protein